MHVPAQVLTMSNKPCKTCELDMEWDQQMIAATKNFEYMCKPCKAKRVMFSRMFGSWPIQLYKDLTPELKKEVWRVDSSLKDDLMSSLAQTITHQKIKEKEDATKGAWKPLGVWKTLGYDHEEIERNCKHKYDPEINGQVYQKHIESENTRDIAKDVKTELLTLRQTGVRSRLSHYASTPTPKKRRRHRSARARAQSAPSAPSAPSAQPVRSISSGSKSSSKSSSSSSSKVSDSPETKKQKTIEAKKEAIKLAKQKKLEAAKAEREKKVREQQEAKQAVKDPMRYIYYNKHAVTTA